MFSVIKKVQILNIWHQQQQYARAEGERWSDKETNIGTVKISKSVEMGVDFPYLRWRRAEGSPAATGAGVHPPSSNQERERVQVCVREK